MALPIVTIVGRPNVGKSSLFNMLAGRKISIVDPTAGVTRDRVSTVVALDDRHFELVDTGGMGIQDHDNLTEDVERQIRFAIESAAVVLFVVDIRDGVVPLDQVVAEKLRTMHKPVLFVANKADDDRQDSGASDLYRLGYGDPLLVSANSRRGGMDLMQAIVERLPVDAESAPPGPIELKLAIVGRRNVGKSTFINALANEERVIVSEVAGTTRDSVDVRFERDGKAFVAIDTAGVRKRGSMATDIEYYSLHRAERSIRRADVVFHFFDARLRIGRVDKQLAEYVVENHKPCVFVMNKWDLVRHAMETGRMADYVRSVFPMLDFVPIAFVTAKKGKNVLRLLNLAQQLHKQSGRRIPTGELNRIIANAIEINAPPMRLNRQGRVYYSSQVGIHPPTVAMVTNNPELFDDTYQRYLIKCLRDVGPFGEVPIKVLMRQKGETSLSRHEKLEIPIGPMTGLRPHNEEDLDEHTVSPGIEDPNLAELEQPENDDQVLSAAEHAALENDLVDEDLDDEQEFIELGDAALAAADPDGEELDLEIENEPTDNWDDEAAAAAPINPSKLEKPGKPLNLKLKPTDPNKANDKPKEPRPPKDYKKKKPQPGTWDL